MNLLIRFSADVDSDGEHCGDCHLCRGGKCAAFLSATGNRVVLAADGDGPLRCNGCLASNPKPEPCPKCGGSGSYRFSAGGADCATPCFFCNGSGRVKVAAP